MERWQQVDGLQHPLWEQRAALVARHIPLAQRVLDIGCGAMLLERHLPLRCTYLPADVVRRDTRTIVCDLNMLIYPRAERVDLITVLGVLEYVEEAKIAAFLRWLFEQDRPALVTYSVTDRQDDRSERAGLGWINHFSHQGLVELIRAQGLEAETLAEIHPWQVLLRVQRNPRARVKRVQVVSYAQVPNFGDRLGYHLINELLPDDCDVVHSHLGPDGKIDTDPCDLMVVGIGNSLVPTLVTDRLLEAVRAARRTIGIFGTQYRRTLGVDGLEPLIVLLDAWYARTRDDVQLFRHHERKIVHLGDWLISAFPMTQPSDDGTLEIATDFINKEDALDRTIQHIQRFRRVRSARLHPLLCALTSAREVAYAEQRGFLDSDEVSGKFRSLLLDIFGVEKPEGEFWPVDRSAVRAYKRLVTQRIAMLRSDIHRFLI
jgi:hypothetical protein